MIDEESRKARDAESASEEPQASRVEGPQSFSVEQAQTEIKAEAARHRQSEATKDADFRRAQEANDNTLRRLKDRSLFFVFMAVILVTVGVSFWAGIWSDQPDAIREWARGLVTLIIGGFVGYLTGRGTR